MTRIYIYTSESCPYCVTAKRLLDDRGISYIELDPRSDVEAFLKQTGQKMCDATVPQIIVGDRHIGGCTDLKDIIDTPEFQQMIGGN